MDRRRAAEIKFPQICCSLANNQQNKKTKRGEIELKAIVD